MAVNPLKVAVIGSGPSAFYATSRLLSRFPPSTELGQNLRVHMYDKSWAPYGLVRYGVAPDHPEVKNCIHKFTATAEDPRFDFFGNVSISRKIPDPSLLSVPLAIEDMFPHYTHLLLAVGSSQPTPIPGLRSAIPALDLVHWYNGRDPRPAAPSLESIRHVTLIGHGNVSLDIARMLLTAPSTLAQYDVPQPVLEILRQSKVEHIDIVSRRGPAEVSFTAKELRELLNLPNATLHPIPTDLLQPPPDASRQQKRILDLLSKGSTPKETTPADARKVSWSLSFFRSPVRDSDSSITLEINELDSQKKARPTGKLETRSTDLVIGSIGSRTVPFDRHEGGSSIVTVHPPNDSAEDVRSASTNDPWFNVLTGRVNNVDGRVFDHHQDALVENVYTSGWAARGAKGVIATTMYDAYDIADRIISDHTDGPQLVEGATMIQNRSTPLVRHPPSSNSVPSTIQRALSGNGDGKVITWDLWKKVQDEESRRAGTTGKQSQKILWDEARTLLGL